MSPLPLIPSTKDTAPIGTISRPLSEPLGYQVLCGVLQRRLQRRRRGPCSQAGHDSLGEKNKQNHPLR